MCCVATMYRHKLSVETPCSYKKKTIAARVKVIVLRLCLAGWGWKGRGVRVPAVHMSLHPKVLSMFRTRFLDCWVLQACDYELEGLGYLSVLARVPWSLLQ